VIGALGVPLLLVTVWAPLYVPGLRIPTSPAAKELSNVCSEQGALVEHALPLPLGEA
jgi:hypothetical protein